MLNYDRKSVAAFGKGAVSLLALTVAMPAFSQERPSEAAEALSTDEIVVTAQRRDQRLLETPISVGVLEGAKLDESSSRGVADVLSRVAGVTITTNSVGNSSIALRGVQAAAGTSPTGYYLDDVPFAFIRGAGLPDANAYDLQRVEVLRGPQGTLYGINALNGVVRVITADADLDNVEAKGRARISHTEGGGTNYGGDAVINTPLIPGKLAVRVVAGYGRYEGFIDSTSPTDPGRNINDVKTQSYRLKINFQPTETINIKAGYHRNIANSATPDESLDNFTTPFRAHRPQDRTLDIYSLAAQFDAGGVSVQSLTGYVENDNHYILQSSGLNNVDTSNDVTSFSQELRAASSGDGPWQWQLGGIYKLTKEFLVQDVRPILAGVLIYDSRSESYAVFADVTRKLLDDRLEISGGLRYYNDEVVLNQQGSFTLNAPLLTNKRSKYDKMTGRAVITWKPSSDAMFYASYGTGFRSGVQQTPSALLTTPSLVDAVPDDLETYEVGAKGTLFGNVLTYEGAVYYMKWAKVQQSLRVVPPAGGTPVNAIVNAPDASGWGFEGSLTLRPTRSFSLNAAVSWNGLSFDEDVTQFSTGANPQLVVLFPKGGRLNSSPEWTASVGASYRAPAGDGVEFFADANYVYGSKRLFSFLIGPTLTKTESDPISTLTAIVGLDFGRWSLSAFGENLTNERGAVSARDPVDNIAVRLRPRTLGVQTSFKF